MNPIDRETSTRLEVLRFPLIVGVVFIHAYSLIDALPNHGKGLIDRTNGTAILFMELVSQGLARAAVPLFFLISGYLFYSESTWTRADYFKKLHSRISTLVIPYILWNAAVLIIIVIGQYNSSTSHYFSGAVPKIDILDSSKIVFWFFGIGKNPVSYQFWFIRDLILLAVASPLIYILAKHIPKILIASLFIGWIFNTNIALESSLEAITFFAIGSALRINNLDIFSLNTKISTPTICTIMLIAADLLTKENENNYWLHKISIAATMTLIIGLAKIQSKQSVLKKIFLKLAPTSFFIFAAHEPLLTILRKVWIMFLPMNSDLDALAAYVAASAICISICILTFNYLNRNHFYILHLIAGIRKDRANQIPPTPTAI